MEHEHVAFGEFFLERLKDKGISLKKLAEITGIAPAHLEALARDDFDAAPSAPYLRGYILRIGKALDFDGDAWWARINKSGLVKNSGALDTLPKNRFIKQSPPKSLWIIGAAAILIIYLAFQAPRIIGKPSLAVTFPQQNPYETASSTLTITGTVKGADSLTLNGDVIAIDPQGNWQKGVLLQNGPNTFVISAKKFLGAETHVLEQIIYNAGTSTASSSGPVPAVHFESSTNATGTPFD